MSSMSVEDNDAGSGSSIRQSSHPQHQNTTSTEDYGMDEGISTIGGAGGPTPMMQMGNGAKGGTAAAAALLAKQRKKKGNKRMGFARSEEVGVHEALAVPGEQGQTNTFTKQASKESTDSDNWLPVLPDRPLGSFVENLGPGQVVGRQVLASPVMGEIMVKLSLDPGMGIVVEVLEAKNLVARHGSKLSPAPYIKAYLMEGKNCIAKAKTQTSRKSTSSLAQQTMVFNVFDTKKKMLQISIAQINLDELDLSQRVVGWYKLFHSNSLVAGSSTQTTTPQVAGGPVRKDSDNSLNQLNDLSRPQ
uniref:C2 domain-containing protein n=1 Tax=Ditylenchus dipsaci TaxID=166011 RepID=A0A915EE56_9BILA